MAEQGKSKKERREERHDQALVNMHKALLDALRHREQEILRFVAILATALGGFIWVLGVERPEKNAQFVAGTYGVLLVLVVGAFYALALGYNFRYLTLQLAKFELSRNLELEKCVLGHWPRKIVAFGRRSRWGVIPWCTPPGIIKVFWVAFLVSILGVTAAAWAARDMVGTSKTKGTNGQGGIEPNSALTKQPAMHAASAPEQDDDPTDSNEDRARARWTRLFSAIPYVGLAIFVFSLLGPIHVGMKMLRVCRAEERLPDEWEHPQQSQGHGATENDLTGRERKQD